MKKILISTLAALCLNTVAQTSVETEDHAKVLTPDEERQYIESKYPGFYEQSEGKIVTKRMFPITTWNECWGSRITANYYQLNCSRNRAISQILYNFTQNYLPSCVSEAAADVGYGRARNIHIVHKGVFADELHSPNSLHAEGRAIDVKEVKFQTTSGRWVAFDFERQGWNTFFESMRRCWGESLYYYNECPLYDGEPLITGSKGKEDAKHQQHLHLSVPYCIAGQYAGNFFRR